MNEKMRAQLELSLKLERHVRAGISLYLSGTLSTPNEVVNMILIREENIYMADYVQDDAGCLRQIRYDRIEVS